MSCLILEKNELYKTVEYWDRRYKSEENNDWLLDYKSFRHIIRQFVKEKHRILMLGCGNSLLSEEMFNENYKNIVNIDYSNVVINKMADHCNSCAQMEWICGDITKLNFPDDSFDAVIEKATIDSMMVEEKDPWNISKSTIADVDSVLTEVSRVLKSGGHFISVTFAQPHFRGPLYISPKYKWSYSKWELGESFHYYLYIMTKGKCSSVNDIFTYVPPTVTKLEAQDDIIENKVPENSLFVFDGC